MGSQTRTSLGLKTSTSFPSGIRGWSTSGGRPRNSKSGLANYCNESRQTIKRRIGSSLAPRSLSASSRTT
jgi:hypothetical protein